MGSITHDKYIEIVEKQHCNYSSLVRCQIEGIVREILADAGTEVEDPPILPGATQGKWVSVGPIEENCYQVWANWRHDGEEKVADHLSKADAKVTTASKELMETGVVLLEVIHSRTCDKHLPKLQVTADFRDALEKAGANINKFRR